jgi:hypothetical protein
MNKKKEEEGDGYYLRGAVNSSSREVRGKQTPKEYEKHLWRTF